MGTTNMMAKEVFLWSIFFALMASSAAWLPGAVYRQRATALRSPCLSPKWERASMDRPGDDENDLYAGSSDGLRNATMVSGSRRGLIRSAVASAIPLSQPNVAKAYTIDRVDPDENDIYAEAQNMTGPLKVLWVGSGALKIRTGGARSGVYKNLFKTGNEVIAVDLLKATSSDYRDAKEYAREQGYVLRYQQGDATKLDFVDETFDVVVCSCFLSQPFDPVVVVNEIQRVMKPGGRFGFFEHKTDIDTVVVPIFGEASIIKLVAYPELQNILAGVVRKV